jgi:hypothetical protein
MSALKNLFGRHKPARTLTDRIGDVAAVVGDKPHMRDVVGVVQQQPGSSRGDVGMMSATPQEAGDNPDPLRDPYGPNGGQWDQRAS